MPSENIQQIDALLMLYLNQGEATEALSLLAKFKDKSFAAGCNRKRIELCEDMDLELQGFLELSLGSLKRISDSLGL